jgi:hypothetical protein
MIAHNPSSEPDERLPHPAPTLGYDAQAHQGIRVTDIRRREPARNVAAHTVPRQVITLAARSQDAPPSHKPSELHVHLTPIICNRGISGTTVRPIACGLLQFPIVPLFAIA